MSSARFSFNVTGLALYWYRWSMKMLKKIYEDAIGGGSVADLGETPVIGVGRNSKKFPRLNRVSEEVTPSETDIINNNVALEDTDTEDVGADSEQVDAAKAVLDSPIENEEEAEEEEEEKPKVRMQRVLQFLVSKPIRQNHSKDNLEKTDSMSSFQTLAPGQLKIGESRHVSRVFNEAMSSRGGKVMGSITKSQDRYVFTSNIVTGESGRDFIFEGDRVKMKALLILLGAEMKDFGGGSDKILNEVDTRVTPVDVLVNKDSLLTDGVRYVEQIVAK